MKKEIPILTGLLITVIVLVVYQIISYNKFKAELEECQTELAICQGNATTTDAIKHETVKLDLDGWTTIKPDIIYLDDNLKDSAYVNVNWHWRHNLEANKPKSTNMLYNYATQRVAYEIELTDMDATVYIPQHKIALDTYRWYREVKGYSIRKSIRLTEKYWELNLKSP